MGRMSHNQFLQVSESSEIFRVYAPYRGLPYLLVFVEGEFPRAIFDKGVHPYFFCQLNNLSMEGYDSHFFCTTDEVFPKEMPKVLMNPYE